MGQRRQRRSAGIGIVVLGILEQALELKDNDEGTDYVLNAASCWVEVGSVSVYIRRAGDDVIVELCRTGDEAAETLDTAMASQAA